MVWMCRSQGCVEGVSIMYDIQGQATGGAATGGEGGWVGGEGDATMLCRGPGVESMVMRGW